MRSFAASLFIFLLAICTSHAASPVTIPVTRIRRTDAYLKGVPYADRDRFAFLKNRTAGGATTIPVTNVYNAYTASIGIGNPPTYYNLVVDTGSSNTFCGAGIKYVRTSTSVPTRQTVNNTYGSGYFGGIEYLDQVTLAPNLTITNQSIGDALSSSGFEGFDGIIGLGPVGLTIGTLFPNSNGTIPTIMDNLFSQGLIEKQVLGVYFVPPTNNTDKGANGSLTYGGTDPSLYHGNVTYVPVTETYPAAYYWGINVTSATYGKHTIIPNPSAGVVDTGTTGVVLADDFFAVYLGAIPGAKWDPDMSIMEIPPSSISSMQPLEFEIGGTVFSMPVAAQLIPQDENAAWGGAANKQYGVVGKLGSMGGEGLDFIIGQKFMERYYMVFDATNNRVGFAETNNTYSTTEG